MIIAQLGAEVIKIDDARLPNRAAPKRGADTDALLAEIGFSDAQTAELRRAGII